MEKWKCSKYCMRYITILLLAFLVVSCRSVKIAKNEKSETQSASETSNTAQNNDVQTTNSEQSTEYTSEIEIVPVNEENTIEIKDNTGKVTTIKGGKVRVIKTKKDTSKTLSIVDKSKIENKTTKKSTNQIKSNKTIKDKQAVKTSLFWRLWWLWLIIIALIAIRFRKWLPL